MSTTYGRRVNRAHAHPIRAPRPFRDALVVLAEGTVFLFVLGVFVLYALVLVPTR